jgi:hypothetical protein
MAEKLKCNACGDRVKTLEIFYRGVPTLREKEVKVLLDKQRLKGNCPTGWVCVPSSR